MPPVVLWPQRLSVSWELTKWRFLPSIHVVRAECFPTGAVFCPDDALLVIRMSGKKSPQTSMLTMK